MCTCKQCSYACVFLSVCVRVCVCVCVCVCACWCLLPWSEANCIEVDRWQGQRGEEGVRRGHSGAARALDVLSGVKQCWSRLLVEWVTSPVAESVAWFLHCCWGLQPPTLLEAIINLVFVCMHSIYLIWFFLFLCFWTHCVELTTTIPQKNTVFYNF